MSTYGLFFAKSLPIDRAVERKEVVLDLTRSAVFFEASVAAAK